MVKVYQYIYIFNAPFFLERFRSEWPRYTSGADVIIFVVDGHDYERVPFAKKELSHLLEDKNLAGKPLLVALNKIDLEPRMTQQEIVKQLNLDYVRSLFYLFIF